MKASYREGVRQALHDALQADPRVFIMGEDIGRYGGSYAVTKGFLQEFGETRIRDTPLSELGFLGIGIGAALGGMHPVVEIMTVNFSLLALDQMVNTAAALRHMSGGQFNVPLLLRMASGAGRQLAAQHSHSLEGWYAHIPGIKVAAPATVNDAYAMTAAAFGEPDPVVIFEHAQLYNLEEELPSGFSRVDGLEGAAVRREGADLSIIAWSACLHKALAAARELAAEGISAEVIDLRVLRPLDAATLATSVAKTRRALVVDEEWKTASLSAEVVALMMEHAFYELDAPVVRVCAAEVPMPYARQLEEAALPQVAGIAAAARALVGRA